MKTISIFAAALLSLSVFTNNKVLAQEKTVTKEVTITLKNSSILPKKITLVGYAPNENGNSTNGLMFGPRGTKTVKYPVGTVLLLANGKQVDVVMSGKSIKADKPFLIVKAEDEGKTFNVNN